MALVKYISFLEAQNKSHLNDIPSIECIYILLLVPLILIYLQGATNKDNEGFMYKAIANGQK